MASRETTGGAGDWERVQALFHEALARPAAERRAWVQGACGGDAALVAEVWSLVEADAAGSAVLDAGLPGLARTLLDEAHAAPGPPVFGRYRVLSRLGEGGMGVVYAARRDDLEATVAIKVLRHAWLSPARRGRFADEQRILAQLDHPGIARIHDADVLPDGTPWFAMEYVDGVAIADFCRDRALPLPARLAVFRDVCDAVAHAHARLVVHRDLKPSNILVRADGRVKLLDFGISKQLQSPGEADAPVDPTRTVARLMTPAYAAPEQIAGGPVSVQTDVYALGVILYELVAGRRPFDLSDRTPAEAEALIVSADPPRPSTSPDRVAAGRAAWADLDVLCLTALQKAPGRRYASVEALVRDLDHFRRGEPLEARPDRLAYRAGKFARRHWRSLATAAVVGLMLAGMATYYTWRLSAARAGAVAEAARVERIQRFMTSLFEGGDEAAGPAADLRVRTLIDRGAQQAAALDADPAAQADLYRTLGELYQKLGEFPRADDLLGRALDLDRRLAADGAQADAGAPIDAGARVGATLVAQALLRLDEARLDEAERLAREGLAQARATRPAVHPDVARATAALGQVLEARGDTTGAIAAGEEAVRLYAEGGEHTAEYAAALGQLADAHYYAGDYDTADAINQRVLAAVKRIYGERHPRVADVLINLGASQVDRGRYREAEAFYRPAVAILEAFYGPDHYRTASALTMLGRALVYQKQFDEGVPLLARALDVQERVNGPVHPRVASALNDLGSAALQQGRLDEAEARFRRMLDVYRQVYAGEHYLQGIALSNLASVLMAKGEVARAEALYREAIGIYTRTQGADHLNTGIARIKLGRALVRQRRWRDAETELLAGDAIVSARAAPTVSWLVSAREDLVTVYEALGEPDKAAAYRAPKHP
ncbi:MAG: serine/threonine-protein kinase [Vicinamibacterales bacterium]